MLRVQLLGVLLVGLLAETASANRGPDRTVELSAQVLHDIMNIPLWRIPEKLLADAQGIAIIPDVIKVGFVGGIRRGRGVVMVRDRDGDWGLPQFLILTGGSVGWQAGIQSTDVILVFRTKKSIEGLLNGKFTLGAGAAVAAGPVGRSAEAATDAELKAEILSYSRGRGVFAGVAIDGSVIEIDGQSHQSYYGSPSNVLPAVVPESAMRLLAEVASIAGGRDAQAVPPPAGGNAAGASAEELRSRLASDAIKLQALLDRRWQEHLALPAEVFSTDKHPSAESLRVTLEKFDRIAADARYRGLQQRSEFQATHEDLRQYAGAIAPPAASPLDLPPPPDDRRPTRAQ
jgi:lipid-binding SYLF domain-containing protein